MKDTDQKSVRMRQSRLPLPVYLRLPRLLSSAVPFSPKPTKAHRNGRNKPNLTGSGNSWGRSNKNTWGRRRPRQPNNRLPKNAVDKPGGNGFSSDRAGWLLANGSRSIFPIPNDATL